MGPSDVWRPYGINECIRYHPRRLSRSHATASPSTSPAITLVRAARTNSETKPHSLSVCTGDTIRDTIRVSDVSAAVHRDGPFVLTDEERSVYTLMVYLNADTDYTGGDTAFVDRDETHAAPPVVVRGAKGKALVFEHDMWHEARDAPRHTHTHRHKRTNTLTSDTI